MSAVPLGMLAAAPNPAMARRAMSAPALGANADATVAAANTVMPPR